jgi:hypothetical protein
VNEPLYSLRNAALALDCPTCFAEPGDVCLSEDGEATVRVHDERLTEFRACVSKATDAYMLEGIEP